MAKRLTDDEIMDYTYNKIFGDLDGIRSGSMFSQEGSATQGVADNAGTPGMSGISMTIKPVMEGTAESGRSENSDEGDDEEEDKLKGISKISPLMAQLHGER